MKNFYLLEVRLNYFSDIYETVCEVLTEEQLYSSVIVGTADIRLNSIQIMLNLNKEEWEQLLGSFHSKDQEGLFEVIE